VIDCFFLEKYVQEGIGIGYMPSMAEPVTIAQQHAMAVAYFTKRLANKKSRIASIRRRTKNLPNNQGWKVILRDM